jgi:hypothetical protein
MRHCAASFSLSSISLGPMGVVWAGKPMVVVLWPLERLDLDVGGVG